MKHLFFIIQIILFLWYFNKWLDTSTDNFVNRHFGRAEKDTYYLSAWTCCLFVSAMLTEIVF